MRLFTRRPPPIECQQVVEVDHGRVVGLGQGIQQRGLPHGAGTLEGEDGFLAHPLQCDGLDPPIDDSTQGLPTSEAGLHY